MNQGIRLIHMTGIKTPNNWSQLWPATVIAESFRLPSRSSTQPLLWTDWCNCSHHGNVLEHIRSRGELEVTSKALSILSCFLSPGPDLQAEIANRYASFNDMIFRFRQFYQTVCTFKTKCYCNTLLKQPFSHRCSFANKLPLVAWGGNIHTFKSWWFPKCHYIFIFVIEIII